jgi:hypothetical protein
MEWFGRNPVGSIRCATTPTCGGHELERARTGLRPSRLSPRLGQAADLAVAQAVVDEDEKFARRSDAPDLLAAPLTDAEVVRTDGRIASLARHGLDGCPAHEARALLGDVATPDLVVGLVVRRGQASPAAQVSR